jgi:hypothetical protein
LPAIVAVVVSWLFFLQLADFLRNSLSISAEARRIYAFKQIPVHNKKETLGKCK